MTTKTLSTWIPVTVSLVIVSVSAVLWANGRHRDIEMVCRQHTSAVESGFRDEYLSIDAAEAIRSDVRHNTSTLERIEDKLDRLILMTVD